MAEPEEVWSRKGHSPFMWWPGWSPNGRRLATAGMRAPTVVTLVDGDTGEEVGRIRSHTRAVNACSWRHDGKMFASAGADGRVVIHGPRGGRRADHHLFTNQSESVDWSPRQDRLVVTARDGSVLVMEPETGEVEFSWPPGPTVLRAAWRPDGQVLAVAREDARVLLVEPHSEEGVLLAHRRAVNDVAWSPDGLRLVTACSDGTVRVWASDGTMLDLLQRPHREGATSVAWSPDGKRIATASWDGAVRVFFEGILEVEDREGHGPPVSVSFRPGVAPQLLVGRSKGPLRLLILG